MARRARPPLPDITSTRSPRVAAVRRLSRRAAERRFVVEGPQAVREALTYGTLLELFHEPGRHEDLAGLARAAGTPVTTVTAPVLAALADTSSPQGLLGVAPLLDVPMAGLDRLDRLRFVVILERVSDPGNAGTVLRTAAAAGADAVVFTAGSVDPHNAKCVRATAGSLWHLPIVSGVSLEDATITLRGRGLQILATTGGGDVDLEQFGRLSAPTGWLFGPEAAGLSASALALADALIRIPMYGRAESLNLSAAAAVCLYATARAHRHDGLGGPDAFARL